jgi:hypothetical protein
MKKDNLFQALQKQKLVCVTCLNAGKVYTLLSDNVGNMWNKHYKTKHQEIYDKDITYTGATLSTNVSNVNNNRMVTFKVSKDQKELYDACCARFCVATGCSFNKLQTKEFESMCLTMTQGQYAGPSKPALHKHLQRDVDDITAVGKRLFQEAKAFHGGNPFLSVLIDGWTSKSITRHYLGIMVTFISEDFKFTKFSLGLYELEGAHSGQNMANCVLEALEEWELSISDVSGIHSDNCPKESSACKKLAEASQLKWTQIDPEMFAAIPLPCWNHTLALAIQYSTGQKVYSGSNSINNNVPAEELLKRTRKMCGHFNHSGKAVKALNKIQETKIAQEPTPFPFDRPANTLHKPG